MSRESLNDRIERCREQAEIDGEYPACLNWCGDSGYCEKIHSRYRK